MKTSISLAIVVFTSSALPAQDIALAQVIIPGEGWKKVEGALRPVGCLTSYSSDVVNVWDDELRLQATIRPGDLRAATSAGDGRLDGGRFSLEGGTTLVLDRKHRTVVFERGFDRPPVVRTVALAAAEPATAWALPDRRTLLVGDAASRYVWSYRIDGDQLAAGEKYIALWLPKGKARSEVSAIRTDPAGRIFVATAAGVQVFDPTGRLCGVLSKPAKGPVAALCFDGADGERLYIACGAEVFVRKIHAPWLH